MNRRAFALAAAACLPLQAQELTGLWQAELQVESRRVPFQMEFEGKGEKLRAAVLNGEERLWSSSASFAAGALTVRWNFYDASLTAKLSNGGLRGTYRRQGRGGRVERGFSAEPWRRKPETLEMPPDISGAWRIEVDSQSRSRVMKGLFRQSGKQVSGTIQRVDGDFGVLEGTWQGNQLRLSHFDLIRATLIEIRMIVPGRFEGVLDGSQRFTAIPLEKAQAAGLAAPPDPARYTGVSNPAEPFRFWFRDLEGNRVSLTDPRFKGKAIIVSITGTWCPNCHDEAPLLKALSDRWRKQGLEVVSVFFEYTGEPQRDHELIRIFMRKHAIDWNVLYAGIIEDGAVVRAFPQLTDFGAFPTTIFLGRDHRVASIHAGFAGPANREENESLKKEISALVEKLVTGRR